MESIKLFKEQRGEKVKLGFIGAGNMARAIIQGIIKAKLFNGSEIIISARSESTFDTWKHFGVKTTISNAEVIGAAQIVFLCVKPSSLSELSEKLMDVYESYDEFPTASSSTTLVSILAGTNLSIVRDKLPMFHSYVRAMPNTPLQVQAGCTAITKLYGRSDDNIKLNYKVIEVIFGSLGIVDVVDETAFHAITALSGSGPAYVYIMIDALSDAGVKQGLLRDVATRFAAQTLLGASKTVLESGFHVGQLKDQVTSSGGTTIYGIHQLEKGKIRDTLFNCIEAATQRSKDMSN